MNSELIPLNIPSRLASSPQNGPQFSVRVKNNKGQDVTLGDPNATRALVALMNMHAVIGGAACHWGGPAALAEIMSSVHGILFQDTTKPWFDQYNFINDAGHTENGIYALRANLGFDQLNFTDLRGFRSIESKLTGHGESHLNPEGVLFSNGPLGSAISQAQGICYADRALKNSRATLLVVSDGACMEGEAKEAFSAIPGLAKKEKMNPFVLIISDNNTKLSGRIDDDAFSMGPSFESMDDLGWNVIKVEQGNNLQSVYLAIESAVSQAKENPARPVCLWVKTVKGYGVKSTEAQASGGHGFPLKAYDPKIVEFVQEIYQGKAPESLVNWAKELTHAPEVTSTGGKVPNEKVQAGLSRAAILAAKEGYPVYSVSADLQGSTGIEAFRKEFPERSVEVGIAEANMVSMGSGLAKAGLIPIVDTFAQFGVTKGNLPLTMSVLSQSPVIGIFSHTGFQDAADGASHQATTYLAATAAIPYTQTIVCSCSAEAEALMYQAIVQTKVKREKGEDGENILFFVGRENFPVTYQEKMKYNWEEPQVYQEGQDAMIVAVGPMLVKALRAAETLAGLGIKVTVVNNPFINRPDVAKLKDLLSNSSDRLITVEDHQLIGGMGSLLCHELLQSGHVFKAKSIGINGEFGQSAYQADQLYRKHQMDEESIVAAVKSLLD